MAEINLLKNELQEKGPLSFGPPGLTTLYMVIGVLALEILLFAGFAGYQKYLEKQASTLVEEMSGTDFEIKKLNTERQEAISFQRRVNNLQILLANHVFWTPVFDELEKFTYKGARYDTLTVDQEKHELVVSGVIPSYTELGKLILGLKQSPSVTNVNLSATSANQSGEAGYTFTMMVSFDQKLLKK